MLDRWLKAVGSAEELQVFDRQLSGFFLHQATITNAALAVVPWLVHVCKEGASNFRVEYLTDVALVEANRLKRGVYFNRAGTEEFPAWLMPDYEKAIAESRGLVDAVIESEPDKDRRHGLVVLMPALFGDADLAWSQWSQGGAG
jgi:hypothetical protein